MENKFKERLYKLRTKKNISQTNISTFTEVSQETISAYENGKNFPSCEVLVRLADYLGTTTDYLLGRVDSDVSVYQITTNAITDAEALLISDFKTLTSDNQCRLLGYLDALKK